MKRLSPLLLLPLFALAVWAVVSDPVSRSDAPGLRDAPADHRGDPLEGQAAALPPAGPSLRILVTRAGEPLQAEVEVWRDVEEDEDICLELIHPELELPWLWGTGEAPVVEASTDASGIATLIDLPDGRYVVRAALVDGNVGHTWHRHDRRREDRLVRLELPGGEHDLAGVAVWPDGRPFHGIVSLYFTHLLDAPHPAATDEAGRFEFKGLCPGLAEIVCAAGRDFRAFAGRVRIPLQGACRVVVGADAPSLVGRVLAYADDRPVAGASVTVEGGGRWPRATLVRTLTDASGRFTARVPEERRKVVVRAEGFAEASVNVGPGAKEVTLRLPGPGSVRGRVFEMPAGHPVAGAVVHARSWGPAYADKESTDVTDEDGRYEFAGLTPGEVRLHVLGGGWSSTGLGPQLYSRSSQLELWLEPGEWVERDLPVVPAVAVEGVVLDEGEAVPGQVEVVCREATGGYSEAEWRVWSGADGRFRIEDLAPGVPYTFGADGPDGVRMSERLHVGRPGETLEVTVRLPLERWLRVKVLGAPSGDPVAGVTVLAYEGPDDNDALARGATGEDGTARLGSFTHREVYLQVGRHRRGHARTRKRVRMEGKDDRVEIRLADALMISGRVEMPDGSLPDPEADLSVSVGKGREVNCDAAACFRLTGLSPGRHRIRAEADLWRPGRAVSPWVEVMAGASDVLLVLSADQGVVQVEEEPSRVRILVLGPDGHPVPRATLFYAGVDADGKSVDGDVTLVVDGRAEMEEFFLEQAVRLTVHVGDAQSHSRTPLPFGPASLGPVPVAEGELLIRLPRERSISGTVVGEAGEPLQGVSVAAYPTWDRVVSGWHFDDSETFTARDGTFRLGGLGETEYMLAVQPPIGYLEPNVPDCPAGTSGLRIVLRRGCAADLTILDPDGRPVPGTRLLHSGARWGRGWLVSDRDGRIEVPGLRPDGSLRVGVQPPLDRRDLLPLKRVRLVPGPQEIHLPRAHSVSGYVPEGGAEGTKVWARPAGGRDWVSARPDLDGRFVVEGLPAGEIDLVLLADSASPWSWEGPPKTVPAGACEVSLPFDPGWHIEVRLRGWRAGWRGNARLKEIGGTIEELGGVEKGGWVRFRNLPSGRRFCLWVGQVGDGLFAWLPEVSREAGKTEVDLRRGGVVRGRLKLPPDVVKPVVTLWGPWGYVHSEVRDGAFAFEGVPEGKWRLNVSYRHRSTGRGGTKRLEVGPGEDVEVVIGAE